MSKTGTKLRTGLLQLLLGVALIGGATYYWKNSNKPAVVDIPEAPLVSDEVKSNNSPTIDVQAALKDRILGDSINADIKISEHSSFTCGHCGHFHRDTFAAFKAAYIDTGKAYLVYSDFPLNAPALQASMVARCLPEDKFFDFVAVLFGTQDDWAYDQGYLAKLESKAQEFGMDKATFNACINNVELRDGILARQQAASKQWEIQSTPSFVVNNKVTISGAYPFPDFDAKIQEAVSPAQ